MKNLVPYHLSDCLISSNQKVSIDVLVEYKQVKVKLYQNGVELRGIKKGIELGSKQFVAKEGQFIISKIDARNGAMGIVPKSLDGAVVTADFLLFNFNEQIIYPKYFEFYTRLKSFDRACKICSEGSTNRVRLKIDKFLNIPIILPSLSEQKRIILKVDTISQCINQIRILRSEQAQNINNLLFSKYSELINDAAWIPMKEVAPIIRRVVKINDEELYPELGIRCFGKGTFHKPALTGLEIGTKKIFQINKGDLVFSNVFAWEGGIAVAKEEDNERYGSHRFISCVSDKERVLEEFLCFHFLSPQGLKDINACSPGGAGRNKTLGLEKLMKINVPVPDINLQREFVKLLDKVNALKDHHFETGRELDQFLPSLLDKTFNGAL